MKVIEKEYKRYGNVIVAKEKASIEAESAYVGKLITKALFEFVDGCYSKGVSKCMDSDTFDYKKGVAIAGAKADLKTHNSFASDYRHVAELLEKAADEARALEAKHREKAECIEKTLTRLTR